MTDQTHNGWTNYETWRVALEVFDGNQDFFADCADLYEATNRAKDYAYELLDDIDNILVRGWAISFLQNVNFREIAQNHFDTENN